MYVYCRVKYYTNLTHMVTYNTLNHLTGHRIITFYFRAFCCCCLFVLKICLINILVVNYKLHTFYILYILMHLHTLLNIQFLKNMITDSILNRQFLHCFSVQITNINCTIHYQCNVSTWCFACDQHETHLNYGSKINYLCACVYMFAFCCCVWQLGVSPTKHFHSGIGIFGICR